MKFSPRGIFSKDNAESRWGFLEMRLDSIPQALQSPKPAKHELENSIATSTRIDKKLSSKEQLNLCSS